MMYVGQEGGHWTKVWEEYECGRMEVNSLEGGGWTDRMRWRVGLRAATVLKQDNECMVAVGDLRLGLGQ